MEKQQGKTSNPNKKKLVAALVISFSVIGIILIVTVVIVTVTNGTKQTNTKKNLGILNSDQFLKASYKPYKYNITTDPTKCLLDFDLQIAIRPKTVGWVPIVQIFFTTTDNPTSPICYLSLYHYTTLEGLSLEGLVFECVHFNSSETIQISKTNAVAGTWRLKQKNEAFLLAFDDVAAPFLKIDTGMLPQNIEKLWFVIGSEFLPVNSFNLSYDGELAEKTSVYFGPEYFLKQ